MDYFKRGSTSCFNTMWLSNFINLISKEILHALATTLLLVITIPLSAQDPGQHYRIIEPETEAYAPMWNINKLSEQLFNHPKRKTDGWWSPRSYEKDRNNGWTMERICSGKFFNFMGDRHLALDTDGHPHIAYGGKILLYAWYNGTEWQIDTVDDSWDVGYCTSLAFDSEGYPHISYYDRDPVGDLKYAYKDVNGWHKQTVDSNNNSVGLYTSLAIDAADHVHISYSDISDGNLKYAHWDGIQWYIETLDSDGFVGEFTSLALDESGAPHISYFDYTNGNLKYARLNSGSWQLQTVDNDEYVGLYTSIAMDSDGNTHISYLDYNQGKLKYAVWDVSQWEITTVDQSNNVGVFSSIALDANDHPHIAYLDYTSENLKYAHFNGSNWVIKCLTETQDYLPSDAEGYFASIALDETGQPHISHMGKGWELGSRYGLRYTYLEGIEWNNETVDRWLEFKATSLETDDIHQPHIGYIITDGTMGYSKMAQNQWEYHNFESPSLGFYYHQTGSGSFLALDANQHPHLIQQIARSHTWSGMPAYESFIYRWYNGDTWGKNTLYSSAWNNRKEVLTSSLVLDNNDQPHIIYFLVYGSQTSPYYAFSYLYRSNSQWYESDIETSSSSGIDHSIALGNDGVPQLSYRKSYSFLYARPAGDQWNIETIGGSDTGYWSTIKTDDNNLPHICFYDGPSGSLKYMHWNGSQWIAETVDNAGEVGSYTSMDFDAWGSPHISYFDVTNGHLKYAYRDGAHWQVELVDDYRYVGRWTSMKIDAAGYAHISYTDDSFCDLKYATKKIIDDTSVSETNTQHFNVYPNPANDHLFVAFFNQGKKPVSLYLVNILGQTILSEALTEKGPQKVSFNLKGLTPGMYFLKADYKGTVQMEKVIVR